MLRAAAEIVQVRVRARARARVRARVNAVHKNPNPNPNPKQVNAVHKNLSIELEISPELPEWVVGDQQRLRQVRHRMTVGGWWGWLRQVLRQRIVVGG